VVRLGLDWDIVEENWDLLRYEKLQDYWTHVAPPLDVMYAAKMGWQPPKRPVKADERKGTLADLISLFGSSGGAIN
jgi:hypothetical protein